MIQADWLLYIGTKNLLHNHGFPFLDPYASRVSRPFGIESITVGWTGPRHQPARLQLSLAPPAHALGNQRPLILGHRPPDLEQQLIVRILAHRPIQEDYFTAEAL